jgi:hypothetical protein
MALARDAPDLDSVVLLDVGDGGLERTAVEGIAVGSLWRAGQDHGAILLEENDEWDE